ncbi:hypothetical protein [Oceanicola sp. 502str15]|uniref:hypothetical protein n=1 Tax=Oceanicola sp. 502str15 TaxID=2696061 RepID=UPI0020954261|nr:hypothetical protein [Oceanicola sp. 502str15]MCO6383769.1 hypothetical protein [Oceanicola sp. 502str15]
MSHSVALLALVSAVFYCIAMFAMKSWASVPSLWVALGIGAALLVAGMFEAFALQRERLGLIYVGILGAEVVLLGVASLLHFEERYTLREGVGIGLVLLGTAIAWT